MTTERTTNRTHRWLLPITELQPLIAEWMQKAGDDGEVRILAQRSGVSERRISGIINGNLPGGSKASGYATVIGFDTADRLLVAMGMVTEWHGRLADYYENQSIEIAPYERGRQHQPDLFEPVLVAV